MTCTCLLTCLALAAATMPQNEFATDPNSSELRNLAAPLVVDASQYGCGPVRDSGTTYFVSLKGDDTADGAPALALFHCTLTGNHTGLALHQGSTNVTVRDSILAANKDKAVSIDEESRAGYVASHSCYFGNGLDLARIESEFDSVISDPMFVDAAEGNFRLQSNSPAAHLALFGRAAGSRQAMTRTLLIENIRVTHVSRDSALITWHTPEDGTIGHGHVQYRAKGAKKWQWQTNALAKGDLFPSSGRGVGETYHAVALTGLQPNTHYEFAIHTQGARCGAAESAIASFRTSDAHRDPTTYYVAMGGDDAADGRSVQTAWQSLRKACFEAGPGDTVLVQPGVYRDRFAPVSSGTRQRRVTFRADGGEVVIDGGGVLLPFVILIDKNYVTFDGFTFANAPISSGAGPCFNIMGCRGVEFLNCRVGRDRHESGLVQGFFVLGSPDFRLEGNTIWGTRYPLKCYDSPDALIKNNTFVGAPMMAVILRAPTRGTRVLNNLFCHSSSAMRIDGVDRLTFSCDHNLFMVRTTIGAVRSAKLPINAATLKQWQDKSGLDIHSLAVDPMFVNPAAGDFRLRPGSPAIGGGKGGVNIGACGTLDRLKDN